jgi:hypothetical protein
MKVKVKKEEVLEIDVNFPLSFKDELGVFHHCFDENKSMLVYSDHFWMCSTSVGIRSYNPSLDCTQEQVFEAFNKVITDARNVFIEYNLNNANNV